jgi:amidohydrolase
MEDRFSTSCARAALAAALLFGCGDAAVAPAAPPGAAASAPAPRPVVRDDAAPVPIPPRGTSDFDDAARALEERVRAWRRDIHRHPELSNREFRTAGVVADHLVNLDFDEVRTEVAHTGVVGVLRGGRPGPTVALRADMDALPVTEEVELPFASELRTRYRGQEVGVMHACGHDAHVAILMGVAELLANRRDELPGNVVFLFQPAEEGAPEGEEGSADVMIREGALEDPRPEAIFGLHVVPQHEVGEIGFTSGGAMASADSMRIAVRGRQTHAAYPWLGVDPIAAAARIVLALHSLPARRIDVRNPSVVSIGSIQGGVRHNIIPDGVELTGTIRALDPQVRRRLHELVRSTAEKTALSADATAEVEIHVGTPVTYNDPALAARVRPTLERVAGADRVVDAPPRTGAEDFAFYQKEIPGHYFFLGIRAPGVAPEGVEPNHSPRFRIDERALPLGVRALAQVALDYLRAGAANGS